MTSTDSSQRESREFFALVYAVFTAGLCSIVYELLIATTVVYFLGDSVKFFSITIGLYMVAMGLGAFFSKYVLGDLLRVLIRAEILLGFLGGLSVPILYLAFSHSDFFLPVYATLTLAIGFLIGLEVPFLTRLLEPYDNLRISLAHVLSLDYFGALVATLAFPLLLLPLFGLFRSGLILGLINMSIGLLLLWVFKPRLGHYSSRAYAWVSLLIVSLIGGGIWFSQDILAKWNTEVYDGRVLHSSRSHYQEIVLSKQRDDIRLYLNGHLQFSSQDEYRYHEALVHVPMAFLQAQRSGDRIKVLVLGGGDGLAIRELLKYPQIEAIRLVDLDPAVLELATSNPYITEVNQHSLSKDSRVDVVIGDAFTELADRRQLFDLIIADLPDPNNTDLARLYSQQFYRLVQSNLSPTGVFVAQSTSPYHAKQAFWTTVSTISSVFDYRLPYHALVPSFGDWGFTLAANQPLDIAQAEAHLIQDTRFLTPQLFSALFRFGRDQAQNSDQVSTLDQPVILQHYLAGWKQWGR